MWLERRRKNENEKRHEAKFLYLGKYKKKKELFTVREKKKPRVDNVTNEIRSFN